MRTTHKKLTILTGERQTIWLFVSMTRREAELEFAEKKIQLSGNKRQERDLAREVRMCGRTLAIRITQAQMITKPKQHKNWQLRNGQTKHVCAATNLCSHIWYVTDPLQQMYDQQL